MRDIQILFDPSSPHPYSVYGRMYGLRGYYRGEGMTQYEAVYNLAEVLRCQIYYGSLR